MTKRVLIVDDDEDMQVLLQEALEIDRYEVSVAGDGVQALATLEQTTPDLILLDLMMPRMDGFTFAHEIQLRGLHTPIIVISADVNARQRVEQMGARGYVTKPFDLFSLLNEVSHCIT